MHLLQNYMHSVFLSLWFSIDYGSLGNTVRFEIRKCTRLWRLRNLVPVVLKSMQVTRGHRALGHQKVRPLITVVFSCPCGSQVTISHGGTPCALTSERAPAYEGCERHRAPNAACSNSKEQKAMQRNGTQHTAIQRKQTVTQRIESIAKHHKAT